MKKLLLSLGALATIVAPVAAVVACSSSNDDGDKTTPPKTDTNKDGDKTTPPKTDTNKDGDKTTPPKTDTNKDGDKTTPTTTDENKDGDKTTPTTTDENKDGDKTTPVTTGVIDAPKAGASKGPIQKLGVPITSTYPDVMLKSVSGSQITDLSSVATNLGIDTATLSINGMPNSISYNPITQQLTIVNMLPAGETHTVFQIVAV